MYGSYGSYSSMCAVQMSAPMDIVGGASYFSTQHQESSCAFPSWPRRSSLSDSEGDNERAASSYLSDEDLFPIEASAVVDDDARSVSSSSGSVSSPMATSPHRQQQVTMTDADLEELQRQRQAYQREVLRFLAQEKERRRQAAKSRQRRGSSGSGSSKKSPKSSSGTRLSNIAEAATGAE